MIQRRERAGIVDFNDEEFRDDEKVSHCKDCLDYGFEVKLQNRIYPEGEPVPSDHDNWLQCHECGSIVARYEIEKESSIKDVVSNTDNPFDSGKDFLGIDNRALRKKRRKQKDEFDYIDDEDVKRELRKGHRLISYTES